MKITNPFIDGLLVIQPQVYTDERGYFYEAFRADLLQKYELKVEFVQDNFSKSKKNTIRGMHYQVRKNAQGKLCQAIMGKVLDVAVDIRFNSPTFGKHYKHELSEENHTMIWIPPGFAHGFAALSDEAVFMYRCTAYYSKEDERSILYNDPDIKIDWQIKNPLVSEKDKNAKRFREIDRDFVV